VEQTEQIFLILLILNEHSMNVPKDEIQVSAILPIRKEEHADFLRSLFNGHRGVPIKIARKEFAGRFIFSLRKYSPAPLRQVIPDGYIPVEIEFPETPYATPDKHFCFFPLEHVEQINDFIGAAFDLFFHVYFFDTGDLEKTDEEGSPFSEITREMLVESFVVGLDMIDFSRASETVKKRQYRKQVKEMARKQRKFLEKDYVFRKKIYANRRKNLNKILLKSPK
jgi:hypothetical protein